MKQGNIAVQTENIFPIIKKFLYSDQEIFLRELVSNAVDATNKLKALAAKGEATGELGDLTIQVEVDKDAKTLTIRDRGIGMTEEEVEKYLNQVAFSSAQEFLEKYKDETNIIGHFGLGFYSAFMVADKVEVHTKSYREETPAVIWTCEGEPSYTIQPSDQRERGTAVVLHINAEAEEYLEESRIEALLNKYCKFLPVPVQFGTRTETEVIGEGEDAKTKEKEVPNIINDKEPIWKKSPSELSDEDYKDFYQTLYPFSTPPMFWIHLNIDYPFNLTGILYFPKVNNAFEVQKNKIQLYSNQVYVTDEVKEIVPEFLTLLHGVIDSPDIPLNVSRSYLQADQNVKKINGYITKKVAEKLNDLFKKDRKAYEEKWNDLSVFVKYGMISDEKFYERATKFLLLKNVDGETFTLEEYRAKIDKTQKDKYERTVAIYTNDPASQDAAITAAKNQGYDVLLLDHIIDTHFIQTLEHKEDKLTFVRVDSDTADNLVQSDEEKELVLTEEQINKVKELLAAVVGEGKDIEVKALSPNDQPIQIIRPEFMRRLKEMQALQGMDFGGSFPDDYKIIVNGNHKLVSDRLLAGDEAEQRDTADYLYKLALLNQNLLKGKELTAFVEKSLKFLGQ
ncbi:MAG: molecular chaperone HtpG [Bacteroidetes bacterium]|nr:MAG: molecular chaperone HtpG [Bacteroidota bacterium]